MWYRAPQPSQGSRPLNICTPHLIRAMLITLHPGIYANDHMRHGLSFFIFNVFFIYSGALFSVHFRMQRLVLPYQPFHQALKTCCCTKACGLRHRSLRCPLCRSSAGALPYVGARDRGGSALPPTKRGRAWAVATACWGCVWQGTDWNGSTAALYLASPKDFLFLHITSAADTRQHPLLAGREEQSWEKYPPKSSCLIQRARHSRWLHFSKPRWGRGGGKGYAVPSNGGKGWGEGLTPPGHI